MFVRLLAVLVAGATAQRSVMQDIAAPSGVNARSAHPHTHTHTQRTHTHAHATFVVSPFMGFATGTFPGTRPDGRNDGTNDTYDGRHERDD